MEGFSESEGFLEGGLLWFYSQKGSEKGFQKGPRRPHPRRARPRRRAPYSRFACPSAT